METSLFQTIIADLSSAKITELSIHDHLSNEQMVILEQAIIENVLKDNPVNSLQISYLILSNQEVDWLVKILKIIRLKQLYIYNCQLDAANMAKICDACKDALLTSLNISLNPIGDIGVTHIAKLVKNSQFLEHLYMCGCEFTAVGADEIAAAISNHPSLIKLDISDNQLGSQGAIVINQNLKQNIKLSILDVSDTNLGPAGGEQIADLLKCNDSIETIYLSENQIGNAAMEKIGIALLDNKVLRCLYIGNNQIEASAAEKIALALPTSNLHILDVSENSIGDVGADKIVSAAFYSSIHTLNLSQNNISNTGMLSVASALKNNHKLEKLNLSINQIGDAGLIALSDVIKFTKLSKLNFYMNQIGDAGIIQLAMALYGNVFLSELNLSNNQITAVGAEALADILNDTQIKELHLYNNQVGDDGSKAIAEELKNNTILNILDLSMNQITNEGAISLIQALKENNTLRELFLLDNLDDASAAQQMAECLKYNSTLTQTSLSSPGETFDEIENQLTLNKKITHYLEDCHFVDREAYNQLHRMLSQKMQVGTSTASLQFYLKSFPRLKQIGLSKVTQFLQAKQIEIHTLPQELQEPVLKASGAEIQSCDKQKLQLFGPHQRQKLYTEQNRARRNETIWTLRLA